MEARLFRRKFVEALLKNSQIVEEGREYGNHRPTHEGVLLPKNQIFIPEVTYFRREITFGWQTIILKPEVVYSR